MQLGRSSLDRDRSRIAPRPCASWKQKSSKRRAVPIVLVVIVATTLSAAQQGEDRVQQLYSQAQQEEKSGRLEEAIQDYQQILHLRPQLPAAHNNLGRLYYQQGKLAQAVDSLRHACQLDPKLAAPRALLGFALFQMGKFEDARRQLKIASQLSPDDVNVKLFLARSLIELKDLNGALAVLVKLEQQAPANTEVLYTLGALYSELAETTTAKIQAVDPGSYLIEVILGRYAEVQQVYRDAAEHYKRAILKSPDNPDLYYRYAHALWAAGDAQAALPEYKHALQLNPYDYRACWEAARIVLSDSAEEAIRLVTRALELKGDIAEAYAIRGRALLSVGKPKAAVEDLRKASALDSRDPAIHFQLARAYRQLGLTEEAQNENLIYERLDKELHTGKQPTPDQQ